MRVILTFIFVLLYCWPEIALGSKILVLLPMSSKSHKTTFDPLISELSQRNHEITLVTIYPSTKPIPNVKTIFLEKPRELLDNIGGLAFQMSLASPVSEILNMKDYIPVFCPVVYDDPTWMTFLQNPGTYDVVLVSTVFNDCYLPVAGIMNAPIIMISPSTLFADVAWITNIPNPWSYVPNMLLPYSSDMTFSQRAENTMISALWTVFRYYVLGPLSDSIIQKYVPTAPPFLQVLKNISFILVNSHFSLDGSKPSMPYLAEIGAIHCHPADKLPNVSISMVDLTSLLDN